jgi:Glycosyl hydrolases family 2, sugar binding domain
VSEHDLTADTMELSFGMIDEDGYIFVNGQKVGESHIWSTPAVFDVKPFLHEGKNIIFVGVINKDGAGGINKSVTLDYSYHPIQPHYQRSVFNGFAQVLVQSAKNGGEIQLTATADGLAPMVTTIQSKIPESQKQ